MKRPYVRPRFLDALEISQVKLDRVMYDMLDDSTVLLDEFGVVASTVNRAAAARRGIVAQAWSLPPVPDLVDLANAILDGVYDGPNRPCQLCGCDGKTGSYHGV